MGVSLAVNCLAVAAKVALVDPAGTATEDGTVRLVELDDRLTLTPVEALTVTVQVLAAPGERVDGAHPRLLIVGAETGTLTVPPVPVIVMLPPAGAAPSGLATPIAAALLPASVTVTAATSPSPIVVAFIPDAMQVYPLAPAAQATLFPADERAAPAVTLKLETAVAE